MIIYAVYDQRGYHSFHMTKELAKAALVRRQSKQKLGRGNLKVTELSVEDNPDEVVYHIRDLLHAQHGEMMIPITSHLAKQFVEYFDDSPLSSMPYEEAMTQVLNIARKNKE